jgi:diguanylate cyclase (GGDEF)-like protein
MVGDGELQRSLLHAIIDASPDGILVVDGRGIIVSHNRRFVQIWQIPEDRLTGPGTAVGGDDNPILSTVLERVKDREAFLARVQELYANPQLDDHTEIELVDGRTLERHSTVLWGQQSQYLGRVWFFRDITTRKQTELALRALARHDSLTGIMNRRYFMERVGQEFARARRYHTPLVLAAFDIDHFKRINDRYGHAIGDEVIRAACNASRAIMRETNLFGRIGGEEFAVLLVNCDINGSKVFAERLRNAVAGVKVTSQGEDIICTVSIGLAARRHDDTSADMWLERADRAMYRAKQNGRNCFEAHE